MQGYTASIINLITDNLRDRYKNGFPILKELIQNADDAKASRLIFGTHSGFPDTSHPLLKGDGLWIFNDGEFTESNADGLRSFGIGSKAGDADSIGKFGLGMKSVFHLCEALFYVAWDGHAFNHDGLTPWMQDDCILHQEWDKDVDWDCLRELGEKLAADSDEDCTWFLLWLPLRKKAHLLTNSGQEKGAIIHRFPGDDPAGDLAFLDDEKLAYDLAEIVPLLQHLERVEHRGERNQFALELTGTPRLLGAPPHVHVDGEVRLSDGYPPLAFSGMRDASGDPRFANMKDRDEWPRTRYRNELGHECEAPDKMSSEAAVIFCSSRDNKPRSRLHWAVFLPVEDDSENLGGYHGERSYSLVLHGQFFLDAGRKKIHDLEHLHEDPAHLDGASIDESLLRRTWNQRLAQDVLLPLVLPALERHAERQKLTDNECNSLTKSILDSAFFKAFRRHVCRDGTWLRVLRRGTIRQWCLIDGDRRRQLRPLPKEPNSDPDLPWRVFPKLNDCSVVPYDVTSPCLSPETNSGKWLEEELKRLLSRIDGLFVNGPSMDYFEEFLRSCVGPHKTSKSMQHQLVVAMRKGLRDAGYDNRRKVATKARCLLGLLQPLMRLEISSELPDLILERLWKIDAPLLLVPKGMDSDEKGKASPEKEVLAAWLKILDGALGSADGDGLQQRILDAIQGLLKTLPGKTHGTFLREQHQDLRVVGVRDALSDVYKPVSITDLDHIQAAGTLFSFSSREKKMRLVPLLAKVIPDANVCLIRASTYRALIPDADDQGGNRSIPVADDGQACLVACLVAVGRHMGPLGDIAERRNMLECANDPGTDTMALRGLRFLLHGTPSHRTNDKARLWIGRHGAHQAWCHLWRIMHVNGEWSLIENELADTVPRNRWNRANIAEIDDKTLIEELCRTGQDIEEPEAFSVEERNEILSRIENKDLWRQLRLHMTVDEHLVSATKNVYLAPSTLERQDPLFRDVTLIAPSENEHVAVKQEKWLQRLTDIVRIEIALGITNPEHYCCSILDSLNRLQNSIPKKELEEDLQRDLQSTAWLPTKYGTPVKPGDVIDLQETLHDEAHRIVAEHRKSNNIPCFVVPEDLDAEVREHELWHLILQTRFSSGSEGLDRLVSILEDMPNYHIGTWKM